VLELWFAFPFAILVSSFAMITGGEGAILFIPFFLLLGIEPKIAIGTAFITQLFGKASGTIGYLNELKSCKNILIRFVSVSIPGVIIGSLLISFIKPQLLQFAFGIVAVILAVAMLLSLFKSENVKENITTPELVPWLWIPFLASVLTGILAIGSGTINTVLLERILKLKMHLVVATVVATMAFTAMAGAIVHLSLGTVYWQIAFFTIAGVLIGGQIGPRLARKMHASWIKALFAALTFIVGIVTCIIAFGNF
jgi:uncharacterized membrane protein YfcA